MDVDFGQAATLIDLDGTAPLVSTLGDCAKHFRALTTQAKADARVLLTQPMAVPGRKTRTWVLNPDQIDALAGRLAGEFLRD